MLTISKTKEDGRLLVSLEGQLNATTTPQFDAELNNSLKNVTELILDFDKVDYVSSAGLRTVLGAQKTMNTQGAMKLINVDKTIREVFELTGFAKFLTIETKKWPEDELHE